MPTADPNAKANELLKNPQFLEMFQRAMGSEKIPDEKDPKRNEWLKAMQERLKAESEAEATKRLEAVQSDEEGKWMWIQPAPGFCIKCSTKKGDKVFVNIGQHERIAEPMPLEGPDAEGAEVKFRIPLSCGAARFDTDKAGKGCKVYDVIVNPNTVKRCAEDAEFRRFVAALTMTWISQKSEPDLNTEEFKNVNFKAKGKLEIQRIRLAPPSGAGNAMNDEIKLPSSVAAGTAPTAAPAAQSRPLVSEVPGTVPKAEAEDQPQPSKPTFTVTHEGLYNWSAHARPARNPYFRASPPARILVEVTLPGVEKISLVEVKVNRRSVQLTHVGEEDEGPFLTIQLPFPVAEEAQHARFVRKKQLLHLVLAVQLPDETDETKTPASRDACEIEAEEEQRRKAEADRAWEERRAKMDRVKAEEERVMAQRKELVEGLAAMQEGSLPASLVEEISKMPPDQQRTMLMRIESRTRAGDHLDQLIDKLPSDALHAICNLIRGHLGLQPLARPPESRADGSRKQERHGEAPPVAPTSQPQASDDRLVEYNYAKKAETLFGVTMYNRYVFALDH